MEALNSCVGSFASTKLVLTDMLNINTTQRQFCTEFAKTTCFLNENWNISGYVAALNSTPVSLDSTKLALNCDTNYKLKTQRLDREKIEKRIFQFFRHAFFQIECSTKLVVGVIR